MVSKSKTIQLFALQVPTQIYLPFELSALTVPDKWKQLFKRLQTIKSGKNYVLPPVRCLNQVLQLLVEGILFSSTKAFSENPSNWLYCQSDQIDINYITTIVKTWLQISLENSPAVTQQDLNQIQNLRGSDLIIKAVPLQDPVWSVDNGKLNIDDLYYDLIPYLLA